jgi:hypothetical protein
LCLLSTIAALISVGFIIAVKMNSLDEDKWACMLKDF